MRGGWCGGRTYERRVTSDEWETGLGRLLLVLAIGLGQIELGEVGEDDLVPFVVFAALGGESAGDLFVWELLEGTPGEGHERFDFAPAFFLGHLAVGLDAFFREHGER